MAPSRAPGRANDAPRPVEIIPFPVKHPLGSCLIATGDTRVMCCVSIEDRVPPWLVGQGKGWVTAEYGMLPAATHSRTKREASAGKQQARTLEIQRLIGRALRAAVRLERLGEIQVVVDCDVLQADGGTRTASVTGGFVALALAFHRLVRMGRLPADVLAAPVAAVSVGIVNGEPRLDLDYEEDSQADTDMNVVMSPGGRIVEIQGTAERGSFSRADLLAMLDLAERGAADLFAAQRTALGDAYDALVGRHP